MEETKPKQNGKLPTTKITTLITTKITTLILNRIM